MPQVSRHPSATPGACRGAGCGHRLATRARSALPPTRPAASAPGVRGRLAATRSVPPLHSPVGRVLPIAHLLPSVSLLLRTATAYALIVSQGGPAVYP